MSHNRSFLLAIHATLASVKPTTTPTIAYDEAIDWLAGRMRWEKILRSLHDRAEGRKPVVPRVELVEQPDPDASTRQADAA